MTKDSIYTITGNPDTLEKEFQGALASQKSYVFIDCSKIDSFFSSIQALIAIYGRRLLEERRELILINLSKRLYTQLDYSGLNTIIKVFRNEKEALTILEQRNGFKIIVEEPREDTQRIILKGTALELQFRSEFSDCFEKIHWNKIKELEIDMKDLEYIGSLGIGIISTNKVKHRCKFKITNANEIVQSVLELTSLSDIVE